jgi:hypothetical protein
VGQRKPLRRMKRKALLAKILTALIQSLGFEIHQQEGNFMAAMEDLDALRDELIARMR